MGITRRDFLNGVAIGAVGGLGMLYGGGNLFASTPTKGDIYYPPALTGLRGNTNEAYEFAHMLRDGESFDYAGAKVEEKYDLIVVGAGISGLCAATLGRRKLGKNAKILILDNHDDFGGHAKRNEFTLPDGSLLLGYGGSESFQSPKSLYSKQVVEFLKSLNIDIDALGQKFSVDFYPNMGLSRGVYFNKAYYGVDKVVNGDPGRAVADDIPPHRLNAKSDEDFIKEFPLPQKDIDDLIRLHTSKEDWLKGMNKEQRAEYADKTSYAKFLKDRVGLSDLAISYFEKRTNDFMALTIDSVSMQDARVCWLPGLEHLGLPELDKVSDAERDDLYNYHFPDGNASVARIMVRNLIPGVAKGNTMDSIVLAKFDYSKLDMKNSPTRLRLRSTAVNAVNTKDGVELCYMHAGDKKLHKVFAKKVVMACYNGMIPYIVPSMPDKQKEALSMNVKGTMMYAKVVISNWEPFIKLGVSEVYVPQMPYARVKIDYPVNIGGYKHPVDPKKPMCLHMGWAENTPHEGLNARDQWRAARHRLFTMPFSEHERIIRDELQGMLGGVGFNHKKDILAITVNRWSHCYSYSINTLFDDEKESEEYIKAARQPFGNITIANSDASWSPWLHTAIQEAHRAIKELRL
ncbi:NAD(P)/FAD-dependent oxidoreductase [Helicobacter muridarum]|uniref:Monoamine oxidase n=1 Tax=Helicobacter muridarum TaxID=216 RepID=A0A099U296_9HELI|nr:NAD(P)/FAD-dependent oxidoreductase [Helicobacter muridarum]TLE00150.1 NAD(P)/FAD-dependent oxidoreductase [Helicobacter muridarum]STQ87044.1 Monoamine oxidase [Helicobacter muridarum]